MKRDPKAYTNDPTMTGPRIASGRPIPAGTLRANALPSRRTNRHITCLRRAAVAILAAVPTWDLRFIREMSLATLLFVLWNVVMRHQGGANLMTLRSSPSRPANDVPRRSPTGLKIGPHYAEQPGGSRIPRARRATRSPLARPGETMLKERRRSTHKPSKNSWISRLRNEIRIGPSASRCSVSLYSPASPRVSEWPPSFMARKRDCGHPPPRLPSSRCVKPFRPPQTIPRSSIAVGGPGPAVRVWFLKCALNRAAG
jgi:hypothetical protein